MGSSGERKSTLVETTSDDGKSPSFCNQVCQGLRGANAELEGKLEEIFKKRRAMCQSVRPLVRDSGLPEGGRKGKASGAAAEVGAVFGDPLGE